MKQNKSGPEQQSLGINAKMHRRQGREFIHQDRSVLWVFSLYPREIHANSFCANTLAATLAAADFKFSPTLSSHSLQIDRVYSVSEHVYHYQYKYQGVSLGLMEGYDEKLLNPGSLTLGPLTFLPLLQFSKNVYWL